MSTNLLLRRVMLDHRQDHIEEDAVVMMVNSAYPNTKHEMLVHRKSRPPCASLHRKCPKSNSCFQNWSSRCLRRCQGAVTSTMNFHSPIGIISLHIPLESKADDRSPVFRLTAVSSSRIILLWLQYVILSMISTFSPASSAVGLSNISLKLSTAISRSF